MAIRTQQFDIPAICFPVGEATAPIVMAVFRSHLGRWINVVNVECAVITEPTFCTFATEPRDQRKLSLPVAAALVDFVAALIPIGFLAFWRAEPCFARLPTTDAFSVFRPAVGEIACLPAVMPGAFADAIGVHLVKLAAMTACAFNSCLFHPFKIPQARMLSTYFDVSCRRIEEAYKQPRLFPDSTPAAEQQALEL